MGQPTKLTPAQRKLKEFDKLVSKAGQEIGQVERDLERYADPNMLRSASIAILNRVRDGLKKLKQLKQPDEERLDQLSTLEQKAIIIVLDCDRRCYP